MDQIKGSFAGTDTIGQLCKGRFVKDTLGEQYKDSNARAAILALELTLVIM